MKPPAFFRLSLTCACLVLGTRAAHPNGLPVINNDAAGLDLTISGTNQGVVLTWFGDDGVAYQLESSPDLMAWTNFGRAHNAFDRALRTLVIVVG